ncbi:glutathione synthase/RimK-type ligase-like ATP-grasp enzyme [Parabacteroides sp. PH5-13]|uniref:ATP-grasp domain-containing protein n=1 Tax=unclassified Parabacteroides TaxID=2649774 RepID=UPI0024731A2E|nr:MULTISPECIES: hypothetical protein [unclassified Parabacteroides]MDH6305587.1 glutathione synthase/RimK-type ligase-like ATP-grasp enzyme [Parabacteroides sp. PH5-39]MDH6319858.1 glutathione synthase/RimK-type ligase-like ATP-grasp enzyme [Parabacteroides sp. PH5-13]MDH6323551.1 glutathione synthase/RimK-type ligase-like ATP-grasp enzyme [Parabacteroides sp. PH5-8]MDH6384663.1 glutathione synthase/RimK-type ligase-like ATP-grasp enzyme [Parabacteroides sp. PH5-17]MDH6394018.1 glutathione sy
MKIAIHHKEGSFSESWIKYCKLNNIQYILVDPFQDDIIMQLQDCDIFMWHYHHAEFTDRLVAKQLLCALEHSGIIVFPNFYTSWHFDDKVAQKYLLESLGMPVVNSYVFYNKEKAMNWVRNTTYPKVFKLRGGAGSSNVILVENKKKAQKLVNKAFKKGFSQFNKRTYFKDAIAKPTKFIYKLIGFVKGCIRFFYPIKYARIASREKGYIYFQDFIPNNDSDIRIIVIGKRSFGIKRMVRENDFRASGSGNIKYDKEEIDVKCVSLAFNLSKKLQVQCLAYDFIFKDKQPLLVEISYGFYKQGYYECPGYWTDDMIWHKQNFDPCFWMIEDVIADYNFKKEQIFTTDADC